MAGDLVYLDNAATTPLRAEARDAMLPWLGDRFGNPSGSHAIARAARRAVDEAREIVAGCLGAKPGEIVFTSGGTEADNLAVHGVYEANGGAVVCTAIEHHAVLHACAHLGGRVTPVDAGGRVDLDRLPRWLDDDVSLVSVMLANNEVGTVQPLAEVAAVVRARSPQAALHTDAVAAFAWLDVAELAAPADLISISAHKFGGPQGVGALVVRGDIGIAPLAHGGGQERERRSGTHNVAGIVGLAAAAQATVDERKAVADRVAALRDRLTDCLLAKIPDVVETGDRDARVAGTCHVRIAGVESEPLVLLLDDAGVCASAGSACASGALEPSHVLAAMGVGRDDAAGALRLSLGRATTERDIDRAAAAVANAVARLRSTA
jgi:cysteine desulfurase